HRRSYCELRLGSTTPRTVLRAASWFADRDSFGIFGFRPCANARFFGWTKRYPPSKYRRPIADNDQGYRARCRIPVGGWNGEGDQSYQSCTNIGRWQVGLQQSDPKFRKPSTDQHTSNIGRGRRLEACCLSQN